MRILIASVVDPAYGMGGGWTATRGLILVLEALYAGAEVECVAVSARSGVGRLLRQFFCFLGSLAGGLPPKVGFNVCSSLGERVRSGPRPDLYVINGSDMLWLLPHLTLGVPVVVVAHNLEYRLVAEQTKGLGWLGRRETARHREYEGAGLRRAGRAIFLAVDECVQAVRDWPEVRAMVLPPVFGYEPVSPLSYAGGEVRLGFLGNLDWWPNRNGLNWFLQEVWPRVPETVRMDLYGPGSRQAAGSHARVTGHGVVADVGEVWRNCHGMIAPIWLGAGVKIKIAEALYNGMPVLATPRAAQGLPSLAGVTVLETAAEWRMFLSGEGVREWAGSAVPRDARNSFTVAAGAERLREFLGCLI
jgi:polysaccharide biosynthesis protein PslH